MQAATQPSQVHWLSAQLAEGGQYHCRELLTVQELLTDACANFQCPAGVSD
jgi:hypothetical protein